MVIQVYIYIYYKLFSASKESTLIWNGTHKHLSIVGVKKKQSALVSEDRSNGQNYQQPQPTTPTPMLTITPSAPHNKVFRSSISGVVIVVVLHYTITSALLMFSSLVRKSHGVQVLRAEGHGSVIFHAYHQTLVFQIPCEDRCLDQKNTS